MRHMESEHSCCHGWPLFPVVISFLLPFFSCIFSLSTRYPLMCHLAEVYCVYYLSFENGSYAEIEYMNH